MNNGCVLVIDDNQKNLDLAEDTLADEGYDVLLAHNGAEGLVAAQKYQPDVIVLDIMMPGINGLDVCNEIKYSEDALSSKKIILLTAKAQSEDILKGFSVGADDYLPKPYNTEELVARVRAQYRSKRSEDALRSDLSKTEHLAAIGNMAGSVAHDFKNILTEFQIFELIKSYSEEAKIAIQKGDLSDAEELMGVSLRLSEMGCKAVRFGQGIVNGLVSFTAGACSEQKVQQISSLVELPFHILSQKIRKERVEVSFDIDNSVPLVLCNSGEIQQVLLNLVANALYSMKGASHKWLKLKLWSDEKSVKMSLSDTGSGILDEAKPYIFDDFFTTKPEGKGTGIGLSTVRKIVKAHKGEISFISDQINGTTFIISLPIHEDFQK